ncbi:MAG: hypothetical protein ACJAWV_000032 [Flammeovirgaceae bacterium]|jgi:uncharacterized protein (TIGR02646 family)
MQYIEKSALPPEEWEVWFTKGNGNMSYDYSSDAGSLMNLSKAKQFLLKEQNGLCAYCQRTLTSEQASIEHFIPKSFNVNLSTVYHNLLAVCKNSLGKDTANRAHCDVERGNKLLPPIVFYKNAEVTDSNNHAYFDVGSDGVIRVSPSLKKHSFDSSKNQIAQQIQAFIEILNLNHTDLVEKRRDDVLKGIMDAFRIIKANNKHDARPFLENKRNMLLNDKKAPFRQFLLIYISRQLGVN